MIREKTFYTSDFLEKQLNYYTRLPEKQRRHFLAMEYERLGKGSQRYLSRVFKCDRRTITNGLLELATNEVDYTRQRAVGGGRKKKNSQLNN